MYIRIREHHSKARSLNGLIDDAKIQSFSYHYGPGDVSKQPQDFEFRSSDPVVIRIDNNGGSPHLHLQGKDHIPQEKVKGIDLGRVDMFRFIGSILKHRKHGIPIEKAVGFKLEK